MKTQRHVRLFRDGRNQVPRIPREFELPGDEVMIHKDGDRLILEPVKTQRLMPALATLTPVDDDFPDTDAGLQPLGDVNL